MLPWSGLSSSKPAKIALEPKDKKTIKPSSAKMQSVTTRSILTDNDSFENKQTSYLPTKRKHRRKDYTQLIINIQLDLDLYRLDYI